jgi:hypothetical protein
MNEYRKKKLLEIVDCQLQFEQYTQVLDTLDSQVEQGYIKRFVNNSSSFTIYPNIIHSVIKKQRKERQPLDRNRLYQKMLFIQWKKENYGLMLLENYLKIKIV